ncbi:hypothetical protein BDN72DRAFT_863857, partial [Pluteus cervinus]
MPPRSKNKPPQEVEKSFDVLSAELEKARTRQSMCAAKLNEIEEKIKIRGGNIKSKKNAEKALEKASSALKKLELDAIAAAASQSAAPATTTHVPSTISASAPTSNTPPSLGPTLAPPVATSIATSSLGVTPSLDAPVATSTASLDTPVTISNKSPTPDASVAHANALSGSDASAAAPTTPAGPSKSAATPIVLDPSSHAPTLTAPATNTPSSESER